MRIWKRRFSHYLMKSSEKIQTRNFIRSLLIFLKENLITILLMLLILVTIIVIFPIVLNTHTPIAYIKSGSMKESYQVGDLLVIKGISSHEINVGDSIAYIKPTETSKIIFHRVVYIIKNNETNTIILFTKGDHNNEIDYWNPVPATNVLGKVIYRIPYLGYIPLLFSDPLLLAELIGLLIIFSLAPTPSIKISHTRKKNTIILLLVLGLMLMAFLTNIINNVVFNVNVLSINKLNTTLRNGQVVYYIQVNLEIVSLGGYIKSLNFVRINIRNASNSKILAWSIWKVVYFFHGTIHAKIAIIWDWHIHIGQQIIIEIQGVVISILSNQQTVIEKDILVEI